MVGPKIDTEDLLLLITKNCQTLTEQTHRKAEGTLEFRLTKPREAFSIELCNILGPDSNWMVGLTSLEVYYSFFDITETIN